MKLQEHRREPGNEYHLDEEAQGELRPTHRAPGKVPRTLKLRSADVPIQREASGQEGTGAGGDERAGGALPRGLRAQMERAFDADFSAVRVVESANAPAVGANAYTRGNTIVFAPGRWNPSTPEGKRLIGHELAHVVQQRQGRVKTTRHTRGQPINDDKSLEREADNAAARALNVEAPAAEPAAKAPAAPATPAPAPAQRESDGSEPIQRDGPVNECNEDDIMSPPPESAGGAGGAGGSGNATPAGDSTGAGGAGGSSNATPAGDTGGARGSDGAGGGDGAGGAGASPAGRSESGTDVDEDIDDQIDESPRDPTRTPPGSNPLGRVDWRGFLSEHGANIARTGLEATRPIPLLGMFTGMGADVIEMVQNMDTASKTNSPLMEATMGLRSGVVLINNIVGHVMYLGELCQDTAIISVVGIELELVIAPADQALATFKAVLQGIQTVLDIGILAGATVGRVNAAGNAGEQAAYASIVNGFVIDVSLDIVGMFTAVLDACSAGLANGEVANTGVKSIKGASAFVKLFVDNWTDFAQALASIWGGDVVGGLAEASTPAQHDGDGSIMPFSEAAPLISSELDVVNGVHGEGRGVIDNAGTAVDRMNAAFTALRDEVLQGREPFIAMRDGMVDGIAHFEAKLQACQQADEMCMTAEQEATRITGLLDSAQSAIDAIRMPTIRAPEHTELGDNALANLAEGVIDTGAAAANQLMQQVTNRLQAAIDAIKAPALAAIASARTEVATFSQFVTTFKQLLSEQIAFLEEKLATVREALAQCGSPEQLIDMLLAQITEVLGMDTISVDDLRQQWDEVGSDIQRMMAWASGG